MGERKREGERRESECISHWRKNSENNKREPVGQHHPVSVCLMQMEFCAGAGGSRTVDELEDEMDEEGVFLPGTATIR